MKFKVNGVEMDASNMRVREVCEAEKALDIDLAETGLAGKTAVALFVAMRRQDPAKPASLLADEVMSIDMIEGFTEGDAGPPDEKPADDSGQENGAAPVSQLTSGPPRLASSV